MLLHAVKKGRLAEELLLFLNTETNLAFTAKKTGLANNAYASQSKMLIYQKKAAEKFEPAPR